MICAAPTCTKSAPRPTAGHCRALRRVRAGDGPTPDPDARHEGPTPTRVRQIHEPPIIRDIIGEFEPALATEWSVNAEGVTVRPDCPNGGCVR